MCRIKHAGKLKVLNNGVFLKTINVECHGNNKIEIGQACRIFGCKFVIYGDNNTIINHDSEINGTEFWCTDGAKIIIQNNVHMVGDNHIASTEGKTIEIGANSLFAHEVVVRNGDSHSILDCDRKRINNAKDVLIGNHVWIRQRAMVLKGSTVGDDCVIGAGSILSGKKYEDSSLIVGIPAKTIKTKVNWDSRIIR